MSKTMTMHLKSLGRFLGFDTLSDLETRLNTILPEQYQDCFEELEPVSMGSAELRYDANGRVAWDEMWGSFCNLAMAGGPPHKGTLLEPGSPEDIVQEPRKYREVIEEACRGIRMVCPLAVDQTAVPGWIGLYCQTEAMAEWMLRAVVVENVSARRMGSSLLLPVGPHYRLAKEVKNIVTVVAKTSHYWLYHMSRQQQVKIGELFLQMEKRLPLLEPANAAANDSALSALELLSRKVAIAVQAATGFAASGIIYQGWTGFLCPTVKGAVWMMRSLVASNVLARREDSTIFVPLDPTHDPNGREVAERLELVHRMAIARGVIG